MQQYVAFLKGINLGKRRVTMNRLAAVFSALGHGEVCTFIASGNVIFRSRRQSSASLEASASAGLERELGFPVETIIRTAEQVVAIANAAPFPHDDPAPGSVYIGLMKVEMAPGEARKLEAIQTETDEFRIIDREFHWRCRTKMSESTVWAQPEVKAVKIPIHTVRNITTMRKLVAKHLSPAKES